MITYCTNTIALVSSSQSVLTKLHKALLWCKAHQGERLSDVLIHLGAIKNSLRDSFHHFIIDIEPPYRISRKQYVLRIHTESKHRPRMNDMTRVIQDVFKDQLSMYYMSEEYKKIIYINTDTSKRIFPDKYKLEYMLFGRYYGQYFASWTEARAHINRTLTKTLFPGIISISSIQDELIRAFKREDINSWVRFNEFIVSIEQQNRLYSAS